jgi:type IV secretory pathway ATPase VirB11/archaellum biosynthesis ATPase
MRLSVIEQNKKFVVAENGRPINLPKSDGQTVVTEFDSREDAETYINILSRLKKQKQYA